METVCGQSFDQERAFYGAEHLLLQSCRFDGPADGESAIKECTDITAENCFFNLRYPFWHVHGLAIRDCELTDLCRAALWYSEDIVIQRTKLHGIKALRECRNIRMDGCSIQSPEFGWSSDGVTLDDCDADSQYFFLRASGLTLENVRFRGKYSFQYVRNAHLRNCILDSKDAFWHGENIVVEDSLVKGEYLAWYAKNITFIRCKIVGTQPLCYCEGLKLVDCEMEGTDLAFERSHVEAVVTTPILSVKNPRSGTITAPAVGELIMDDPLAQGRVVTP